MSDTLMLIAATESICKVGNAIWCRLCKLQ